MSEASRSCDSLDLRADRAVAIVVLLAGVTVAGLALHGRRASSLVVARPSPIDLNSASSAEIELLPEIGPALAARIVESRERDGAFGSVRDLDRVRGIGKGTIDRVSRLVECLPPR